MSFFTEQLGQAKTVGVKLTTTSSTEIYASAANRRASLKSLSICEISGGATTIDVSVSDGTTTWYIYKGMAVAANQTILLTEHNIPLLSGWTLDAQAGDANQIDLVAVLAEITGLQ